MENNDDIDLIDGVSDIYYDMTYDNNYLMLLIF